MKWCIQAHWIIPSVVYVVLGLEGELRFLLTCSNYGCNGMSELFCIHRSKHINICTILWLLKWWKHQALGISFSFTNIQRFQSRSRYSILRVHTHRLVGILVIPVSLCAITSVICWYIFLLSLSLTQAFTFSFFPTLSMCIKPGPKASAVSHICWISRD